MSLRSINSNFHKHYWPYPDLDLSLFLFQLSGEFRECDLKPWKPSHKQQKMWSAFVTFSQVGQIQDSIPHLLKLISTCHGFIHAAHKNAFVFQNLKQLGEVSRSYPIYLTQKMLVGSDSVSRKNSYFCSYCRISC